MSRWKAATIHLSISAAIAVLAALLIFGVWYPPPYSRATGAPELVMLLLGVDLVLGPLLTLVVFKAGKKGMAFDLSVIALLQTCALAYGVSVVARARPAFIVGAVDRFVLVSAKDIDAADLAQGAPAFRKIPWTGPRIVNAELPTDPKAREQLMFGSLGGKDIERLPRHYVDYAAGATRLLSHARPLDALRAMRPESAAMLEEWLRSHQREPDSVAWLPIVAHNDATMLLDSRSGEPLDALAISPW